MNKHRMLPGAAGRVFVGVVVVSAVASTHAQVLPGAADFLRAGQATPVPAALASDPVVQSTARAAMTLSGDVSVSVRAFTVRGNTVIDTASLQRALDPYRGRKLGANELVAAAAAVRQVYLEQGYFLAVVYLPRQDIDNGHVEIVVLEGRLGRIEIDVDPNARITPERVRTVLAASLLPGQVLTLEQVERPLMLLRERAGLRVSSELVPGETQGSTDLHVRVRADGAGLVSGQADTDNYGVRYAGAYRVGAQLTVNSPLNQGDRLTVRAQWADPVQTNLGALDYQLPVGSNGTVLGLSAYVVGYQLSQDADFVSQQAHGAAKTLELSVAYPVWRSHLRDSSLRLAYDMKSAQDYLVSLPSGVNDRSVRELSAQWAVGARQWGGLTFASLQLAAGTLTLNTPDMAAADALGAQTAGSFGRVQWSVGRQQDWFAASVLSLTCSGQRASKNLDSLERFALGGPTGVRAYPVGDAAGDDGVLVRAEWQRPLVLGGLGMDVSMFYDWGQVQVYDNPSLISGAASANTLVRAGPGVGASSSGPAGTLWRLSLAVPTAGNPAPSQSDPQIRNARAYFQVSRPF